MRHFVELRDRSSFLAMFMRWRSLASCSSSDSPHITISSLIPTHPSHWLVMLSILCCLRWLKDQRVGDWKCIFQMDFWMWLTLGLVVFVVRSSSWLLHPVWKKYFALVKVRLISSTVTVDICWEHCFRVLFNFCGSRQILSLLSSFVA